MEKTMFRIKTILFTIYNLLCLYTIAFCAYQTVAPINSILCRTDFADKMLRMNEWGPGFYIPMVIIGGACCIFLCIEYSNQPKVFVPLLISLVIHPTVIFTMGYIYVLGNPTIEKAVKYFYWFLIACTIAVIVYSIDILIKETKSIKAKRLEA